MRIAAIAAAIIVAGHCMAGFRLPGVPDVPGPPDVRVRVKIPGLDRILKEKPALTTSLADARTGIAFLDDFDPPAVAPLVEVPRGPEHCFMLGPGGYEGVLESYCLHAGMYAPGRGEGYLWAPVRGPLAPVVTRILTETAAHPKIEQADVQLLLWGLLARARISEMPGSVQRAARSLLTREQIRKLDRASLAPIPAELADRAFGKLPPLVRRVLEAEGRIRDLFASGASEFEDFEAVAILEGEPTEDEGGPLVPRGRWSYRPGGFFVRYFPDGYSRTRTQVFVPGPMSVERDELGRITCLADAEGRRLEIEYDDSLQAREVRGDAGVKGYAFRRVILTDEAGGSRTVEGGWTLVGAPSGKGRPSRSRQLFDGLAERYARSWEHVKELRGLVKAVRQLGGAPLPEGESARLMEQMMGLANCYMAVKAAVGDEPEAGVRDVVSLPQRAWMLGLVAIGESVSYGCGVAGAAGGPVGRGGRGAVRLAAARVDTALLAPIGTGAWSGKLSRRALERFKWPGGRRPFKPGKPLRPFRPSGDSAQPAGQRQRLGQSNRPTRDDNGKESLEKARNAIDLIGKGKLVVDVVSNPAGALAGKVGFGIQDQMLSGYFDWLFDTASQISEQLGGDPPRPDFKAMELVGVVRCPLRISEGPPGRRAALQALLDALYELVTRLRAGVASMDRLGGAVSAGHEQWIHRQAAAVMEHKRAAGEGFIRVADCLDAVLEEIEGEGIEDIVVTAQAYSAYQTRLRERGFTAEELEAARRAGLSDVEVAAALEERLSLAADDMAGSLMEAAREAAAAMRELGQRWASLPGYDLGILTQAAPGG